LDTYTQPIGTYTDSRTSNQMNFTNAGIASAYEAAFRQIGNAMLAHSKLLAGLEVLTPCWTKVQYTAL